MQRNARDVAVAVEYGPDMAALGSPNLPEMREK
jgi:hypothetical protein